MANFKPLKVNLILLIDQLVNKHNLTAPFLDAGCGLGDISLHFAKKGWAGKAIDLSANSIEVVRKKLIKYPKVVVKTENFFNNDEKYNTIFACDVIEHIKRDKEFIQKIGTNLNIGGKVIISVPVFKSEWRWDDEFYGHIRRYEINEIFNLLKENGFKIHEMWDFTFPIFWLIRRIYTRILPRKIFIKLNKKQNTIQSSMQSAWDYGVFTNFFERIIWWQPIYWLQDKFKNKIRGCEVVILAEKIK